MGAVHIVCDPENLTFNCCEFTERKGRYWTILVSLITQEDDVASDTTSTDVFISKINEIINKNQLICQ